MFVEELERDPARFLPEVAPAALTGHAVSIDLSRPTAEVLAELSRHPVKTRLDLSGTLTVARDAAHARIKEALDSGGGLPDFMREHPVYYAGPAKTPAGLASKRTDRTNCPSKPKNDSVGGRRSITRIESPMIWCHHLD